MDSAAQRKPHRYPVKNRDARKLAAAVIFWVLAVGIIAGQAAQVNALQQLRHTDAVQVERAERIRDMALRQLGALALQAEADAQARAEQAAAYEAAGVYRYVGQCKVTAYCPCVECCGKWADGLTATGIPAGPGIVAVDPERIPLGSTVVIDGQKYLAADTGVTGLHVDVCVADHASTVEHGVRTAQVWVMEDDEG